MWPCQNPNSSGTGFLDVSSWLQMFGEEGGWEFMDALHENISHYTHSGSKPCKQAAAGEVPIGISFAFRGAKSKAARRAPRNCRAVGRHRPGTWKPPPSLPVRQTWTRRKSWSDWSVTPKANELYNSGYAVVAIPGIAKPVEHFPDGITEAMIDNRL